MQMLLLCNGDINQRFMAEMLCGI